MNKNQGKTFDILYIIFSFRWYFLHCFSTTSFYTVCQTSWNLLCNAFLIFLPLALSEVSPNKEGPLTSSHGVVWPSCLVGCQDN